MFGIPLGNRLDPAFQRLECRLVFGLGIAAAISFERTGLLIAPIAAHVIYNGAALAAQLAGKA
ncbi:MAG TPA: hypothetical protein VM163_10290 [bacterium]|nr:hypothetical protein [bacterium]